VLQQCLASQFSDSDVLSDFNDGNMFKTYIEGGGSAEKCPSLKQYPDSLDMCCPAKSPWFGKVQNYGFLFNFKQSRTLYNRSYSTHNACDGG
jgi:hypothetical protein